MGVPTEPEPLHADISLVPPKDPKTWLDSLPDVPTDEIFDVLGACIKDPSPDKVNLSIGVYRTEDGKPWVLPVVEQAERQLEICKNVARHEYLPIAGDVKFLELARDLALGFNKSTPAEDKSRIVSAQTISGSGANHVGAAFLNRHFKPKNVWISDPTWANHHAIWELTGPNIKQRFYPYYNAATRSFDFKAAMETLESDAQAGDVILLQACAHNPTGLDPTPEQWKAIADLCERKKLFVFFDMAYQGFASGSPADDAWPIRHFFREKPNFDMLIAQSFSKNFGLYGQRVGALHFVLAKERVARNPQVPASVYTHLCNLIRGEYSMAPSGGSAIVKTVLQSPEMMQQWHADLDVMSGRIKAMRQALYDELLKLRTPGTWEHIVNQTGMFSYVGLTAGQVKAVREHYHVYMLSSGRASMSGLNAKNAAHVAKAIDAAVRGQI